MPPSTKKITQEGQAAKNRIAEFRQNVDNGATAQEARQTVAQITAGPTRKPSQRGVEAITPTELKPTAVIDVPTPAVATKGQSLAGDIAEQSDAFTKQQEAASTAAESTKNTALENYLAGLQSSQGIASLTDQEYSKEGGVDSITPELNDINDKIRREQMSLRRATEGLTNAGGQSKAQTAAAIANKERDSFQKQADLSVIQLATQGRYDSAIAQADRAVQAKFEQQKIYNDTLQFAYSEAKDIFTQAEQREFETLLGNRNRAIEEATANANEIYRIGIEAQREGAPADVVERMLSAKSKEDAASIGGSYIGALDREAKRANIAQSYASVRSSNASAAMNELQLKLTREAAAKATAAAKAGILTGDQVATAQTINKDFEDEPIVKAYNEALTKSIVLEDTLENGIDGIQDLQLVYDFMKAVDPTSVVRESEFANAAQTGNMFQGTYARFNKAFGTGGFLPEEVKNDFIRASRASFDANNTQYYNVKNEKANQINQRLGINNGADYLTAYESAAPLQQVDFDIADSLSGATPEDMQEIMLMQQQLLANPSGQSGR